MRDIDRLKYELAEAVRDSEEYQNYLYYKKLLDEKPDIRRSVDEMRSLIFQFQNSDDLNKSFEEIDDIRRRFDYERTQNLANDFLKAELCLCRMIQDICKTVVEDIDFDLDFLK